MRPNQAELKQGGQIEWKSFSVYVLSGTCLFPLSSFPLLLLLLLGLGLGQLEQSVGELGILVPSLGLG